MPAIATGSSTSSRYGDRSRVLDALGVGERVARDARGDRQREHDAARVGVAAEPAHEHDASADEEDAECLRGAERFSGEERAGEDEDRRDAARDRVDEAQVGPAIRAYEQAEVDELEHGRDRDPGQRRGLDPPRRQRDWRREHDRERKSDARRGADVAGAREQGVPAGMEHRGAQCERERGCRHG